MLINRLIFLRRFFFSRITSVLFSLIIDKLKIKIKNANYKKRFLLFHSFLKKSLHLYQHKGCYLDLTYDFEFPAPNCNFSVYRNN